MRTKVFLLWPVLFFQLSMAYASEGLENMMLKVSPGMTKEQVVSLFGNPDYISDKTLSAQGKPFEVWKYDPLKERNVNPVVGAMRSFGSLIPVHSPSESETALSQKRLENPPYVITLVDGIVQTITRGTSPPAKPESAPFAAVESQPAPQSAPQPDTKTEFAQKDKVTPDRNISRTSSAVRSPVLASNEAAWPENGGQKDLDQLQQVSEQLFKLETEIRAYVKAGKIADSIEEIYFAQLLGSASAMEASVAGLYGMVSLAHQQQTDRLERDHRLIAAYLQKVKRRFGELQNITEICQANRRYDELAGYADKLDKAIEPLGPILKTSDTSARAPSLGSIDNANQMDQTQINSTALTERRLRAND